MLDQFLPKSLRDARAFEFERLVTTLEMIVMEYDQKFCHLSCYANHLVSNEEKKVRRFVRGLDDTMFKMMYPRGF